MTRLAAAVITLSAAGLLCVGQAAADEFEFLTAAGDPGAALATEDSPALGPIASGEVGCMPDSACDSGEWMTGGDCLSCADDCSCGLERLCGCGDGWRARLIPYGWLYEMHGDVTIRGQTAEVSLSTRDMLDLLEHNVHFMAAGRMELEHGRWSVLFDGMTVYAGLGGAVERLSFSSNIRDTILELVIGYELAGLPAALRLPCGSRFDLLAGGRYHLLEGGVTITGQGPLGLTVSADGDRDWVDPLIGGRIRVPIQDCWTLLVRGDVGGFGWGRASDFTWNLEAVVEYRCSQSCALWAGYRVLDIDQQIDEFGYDMQYRGPLTALVFEY